MTAKPVNRTKLNKFISEKGPSAVIDEEEEFSPEEKTDKFDPKAGS